MFSQICFTKIFREIFSAWAVEKENEVFIGPKQFFSWFWTNEKFVFFLTVGTKKIRRKIWGKQDWLFDVANKILIKNYLNFRILIFYHVSTF